METPALEAPRPVTPETATENDSLRIGVVAALRDVTRSAITGGLLGVLVLGLGGRIAMRVAALLHPEAVGFTTQNGNAVGDITVAGTIAIVLFGGLLFGLIASVVWVAVGPWLPGRGWARGLVVAPVAVALSGVFLVERDNFDFGILGYDPLVIATLIGLIAAFGLVYPVVDEWLDRHLPPAGASGRVLTMYAAPVVMGSVLILPIAVGFYFSRDVCRCSESSWPMGLAIVVAGFATVAWWLARAKGASRPPTITAIVGALAVVAGVGLGLVQLVGQVGAILEHR